MVPSQERVRRYYNMDSLAREKVNADALPGNPPLPFNETGLGAARSMACGEHGKGPLVSDINPDTRIHPEAAGGKIPGGLPRGNKAGTLVRRAKARGNRRTPAAMSTGGCFSWKRRSFFP